MRENIIMMTNAQKADRLALIREIAEKRKARLEFKQTLQSKNAAVRNSTARKTRKTEVVQTADAFFKSIDKMDENYNQWTDASKYANQYYGDTMRATTRFDNDWD
jgi:hypothetical protein